MSHLAGTSNRQIASKMHISKDTVNKYVKEYDAQRAELLTRDPDAGLEAVVGSFGVAIAIVHTNDFDSVHVFHFSPSNLSASKR